LLSFTTTTIAVWIAARLEIFNIGLAEAVIHSPARAKAIHELFNIKKSAL